jgi:hypothetical protein
VYRTSFRTREEADLALFGYIDGWYNPHRIQRALGWQSPNEDEAEYRAQLAAQPASNPIRSAPDSARRRHDSSHARGCTGPLAAERGCPVSRAASARRAARGRAGHGRPGRARPGLAVDGRDPARNPVLDELELHGPHDFRHTYATCLEDAGIPSRVIDELMGHGGRRDGPERSSVIGRRYRWTTPEMAARVVAAIEARLAIVLTHLNEGVRDARCARTLTGTRP